MGHDPLNDAPEQQPKRLPEAGRGLCLSGGGYRAMLFHVGVILRLNEMGLLRKLNRISAVSGGSITAAVLGMNWNALIFNPDDIVDGESLKHHLVDPIRKMASRTIDVQGVIGGIFMPGTISERVEQAYDETLYKGASLQDLPTEKAGEAPRIVLNATNVQTGSLWRFSKPYMADWQVGIMRAPKMSLARAVAASSAFPPVLSPCVLELDPDDFEQLHLSRAYASRVVLSDGGVYDNMGMETVFKRYTDVLVSDAGAKIAREMDPAEDWALHSLRINGIIDNQVRCLRKRALIAAFEEEDDLHKGAYWSIRDPIEPGPDGAHPYDPATGLRLAATPTRLKRLEADHQEMLINWGYVQCDRAVRKHYDKSLAKPAQLPFEPWRTSFEMD